MPKADRTMRRQVVRAVDLLMIVAIEAVEAGIYPSCEVALFEMAAGQRQATRAHVDAHALITEATR